MRVRAWIIAIAVGLSMVAISDAEAGRIGLSWSESPGAVGYRVYWGDAPGSYSGSRDVGSSTTTVVDGLTNCSDTFFAVTAYNAAGESGFSNEVASWPYPEVDAMTPSATRQGEQFTWSFQGANFDPADEWEIVIEPEPCFVPDPARPDVKECSIFHDAVPTVTCNRVEVVETVDPLVEGVRPARTGTYTVTLANADGSRRTSPQTLTVSADPERFNINRSTEVTAIRLDGLDLVSIARLWAQCDPQIHGAGCNPSLYDPDVDFDGDGYIDGDDLSIGFGSADAAFGGCWDGTRWTVAACPASLR